MLLAKLAELDYRPNAKKDEEINEAGKCNTLKRFLYNFFVSRQPLPTLYRNIIVIDGQNLKWALKYAEKSFVNVSSQCEAVICCRVTPLQKSSVVQLIGQAIGSRTLAIGDGANDVSMIQDWDITYMYII